MSKRNAEEIIQSVERCIRGESTRAMEGKRLGVSRTTFQSWLRRYETFGSEGFRRTKNQQYSSELKQAAVRDYLSEVGSQADICKKYKIHSRTQLREWVKVYNGHGELRPSRGRGSDIYMTKGRATTYDERIAIVSYCIEHGNDYTAAIEKYGISYQQIYAWVRKYREKGAEGLLDRRGKRKPEAEMTEAEKLRAENRLLEARNRRLETENAVLKKLEELERRWR